MSRRQIQWPKITRRLAMFGLGFAGFIHELLIYKPPINSAPTRDVLVYACLVLMGLPIALQFDESRRAVRNGDEGDDNGNDK